MQTLELWLTHSQSDEDESRLNAMGNIVVPYAAWLAGAILLNLCRLGQTQGSSGVEGQRAPNLRAVALRGAKTA